MKIDLPAGKYVLAVSGGVDSMVLLYLAHSLPKESGQDYVVAHVNHGIREDSIEDERLVSKVAEQYGMTFTSVKLSLGEKVSEAEARKRRYDFLFKTKAMHQADSVVTAHHQDDLIETAFINIKRGTNRRGLTAILNNPNVIRPLTSYSKKEIIDFAVSNNIIWREDHTNSSDKYLRNRIRHTVVPRMSDEDRVGLIDLINDQDSLNKDIDAILKSLFQLKVIDNSIPRLWFSSLDNSLAKEVLAFWLRQNGVNDFDAMSLTRLVTLCRVSMVNSYVDALKGWQIYADKDKLALVRHER